MVACEQKYCVNCVRPVFKDGKFLFGRCKARPLILYTSSEDDIDVQPLYCYQFKRRKKKINY